MNIYVGNLSYDTTEDDLRAQFAAHGEVDTVNIIKDKYSGQSKGFGFVEMSDDKSGQAAIDALNGAEIMGRNLKVDQAKPRVDRDRGGSGDRY
jgi:RNA recognition motif-containing protein